MKPGTKIVLHGSPSIGGFPAVAPESANIGQWRTAVSGPRMPGWHIVRFNDGGRLCVHESRFDIAS